MSIKICPWCGLELGGATECHFMGCLWHDGVELQMLEMGSDSTKIELLDSLKKSKSIGREWKKERESAKQYRKERD